MFQYWTLSSAQSIDSVQCTQGMCSVEHIISMLSWLLLLHYVCLWSYPLVEITKIHSLMAYYNNYYFCDRSSLLLWRLQHFVSGWKTLLTVLMLGPLNLVLEPLNLVLKPMPGIIPNYTCSSNIRVKNLDVQNRPRLNVNQTNSLPTSFTLLWYFQEKLLCYWLVAFVQFPYNTV